MQAKQASKRREVVKGHPGVYLRSGADGKRQYEISYLDSEGNRRWKRVQGDLKAADAALRAVRIRLDQGQKVIPTNRPFEGLAWEWYEREKDRLRPNTQRNYEGGLRLHVLPRLGKLKPAEITEDRVAGLIRAMEREGKSNSTIRNALAPLSRILNHLARRGMVQGNVILRLERAERPQKAARSPKRILDRDEIRRLLEASKRYRLILSVAVNSGLRQSEILGLVWGSIDFKSECIRVTGQLERGRMEAGVWLPAQRVEYAKTDAGSRTVELIPSDIFLALKEHRLASRYSVDGDFVFATSRGTPMDHRNVAQRGLDKPKEEAGLDGPGKPSLRFHDLRHTYASANIAAGVDVVYLSRQLGHAQPSITLDIYADLFEAREKAATSRNLLETSGYSGLV
jgi:integrase